jgi:hypothetical protein
MGNTQMTFEATTFKATTPDEMRLEIINWLLCQAVHYRIDAALAKRKTVDKEKTMKAQTYNDIAGFLSRVVIINSKEETKDAVPSQG